MQICDLLTQLLWRHRLPWNEGWQNQPSAWFWPQLLGPSCSVSHRTWGWHPLKAEVSPLPSPPRTYKLWRSSACSQKATVNIWKLKRNREKNTKRVGRFNNLPTSLEGMMLNEFKYNRMLKVIYRQERLTLTCLSFFMWDCRRKKRWQNTMAVAMVTWGLHNQLC